jgi:hypothetical protein
MRISTPEVQQAWAALQRGDCEAAWNTLWPLAKNGNQEARYFLYSATGKVNPPGVRSLNLGANGERVSQCYAGDASLEKCLNLGVSLGVIPTFEEYARQTELAAHETGVTAHCFPRH